MEKSTLSKRRVNGRSEYQRVSVVEINQYTSKPTNPEDTKCATGFHMKFCHPSLDMQSSMISIYSPNVSTPYAFILSFVLNVLHPAHCTGTFAFGFTTILLKSRYIGEFHSRFSVVSFTLPKLYFSNSGRLLLISTAQHGTTWPVTMM